MLAYKDLYSTMDLIYSVSCGVTDLYLLSELMFRYLNFVS